MMAGWCCRLASALGGPHPAPAICIGRVVNRLFHYAQSFNSCTCHIEIQKKYKVTYLNKNTLKRDNVACENVLILYVQFLTGFQKSAIEIFSSTYLRDAYSHSVIKHHTNKCGINARWPCSFCLQ